MTIIEPTRGRSFTGLRGGERELSRQRALQLFPAAHEMFARKMDHGRAEAVLIALRPIQGISVSAEKTQPKAPMTSASQ